MKDLPKELTPELLSLVLDDKSIKKIDGNIENNDISYFTDDGRCTQWKILNIDTLTMKCLRWCWKQGYSLIIQCKWAGVTLTTSALLLKGHDGGTEFEAVLKATHFVATEKGLLDG